MTSSEHPPRYFVSKDGSQYGLNSSRWDQRHRLLRVVLPDRPNAVHYLPLIDMVRPGPHQNEVRYVGQTAEQWLAQMGRRGRDEELRALTWLNAWISAVRHKADRRPRIPENNFAADVAIPPIRSLLPDAIAALGLKRAAAGQWLATVNGLTSKGIKLEELKHSGVLLALERMPAETVLTQTQVLKLIDLDHVLPKLVCEAGFGFASAAGWRECCQVLRSKRIRRRGAAGNGRDQLQIVRYRHRTFGWGLVRTTHFADLLAGREDSWRVIDDRGKPIKTGPDHFSDLDSARSYAEAAISTHFAAWCKAHQQPSWQPYTLGGGIGYREILIQLDDWPYDYKPRHFRTRNVLVHLRTTIRMTADGRRLLYLEEIQSDWHADLHAEAKSDLGKRRPTVPPPAPFAKEWPLLALKLMLWWSQRLGVDGLAWSTLSLQQSMWGKSAPDNLYRQQLPDAAALLAKALSIDFAAVTLPFRPLGRIESRDDEGWAVTDQDGVAITKPFATYAQAEQFANLITRPTLIDVPVLWLQGLAPIRCISLFGVGGLNQIRG